jgi:uncharacterized protein (TIGR02246 family)
MLTRRSPALLLAVAALAACAKPETPEQAATRMQAESDAVRPAIEAGNASYVRYFNAGQADSLAALHTENTHVMPPNGPAVHGRDGVRELMTGFFQQAPSSQLTIRVEDVAANGPMAVDRGRWSFTPQAGTPMPADSGKYLVHWHRQADGSWQIQDDIWNSDVPLPPPPPARRR